MATSLEITTWPLSFTWWKRGHTEAIAIPPVITRSLITSEIGNLLVSSASWISAVKLLLSNYAVAALQTYVPPCAVVAPPIRRYPPSSGIRIVLLDIKVGIGNVS